MDLSEYVGIPYEQCDCWQLVCKVYKEKRDILLPTFAMEYINGKDINNIKFLFEREVKNWRQTFVPALYDVVSLRIFGLPWHVGMIIDVPDFMLHTMPGYHSRIERISSPFWMSRVSGYYRYIGRKK